MKRLTLPSLRPCRLRILQCLLLPLITASPLTFAQTERPPASAPVEASAPVSAVQRADAIREIKAIVQERYVFPEMRPVILGRLDEAQAAGRYDVDDPRQFAERVTVDLRTAGHDKHLSLAFDPAGYAAALAPAGSAEGSEAQWRREAIRHHHGLDMLQRLPGNLRYLRITTFEWVPDETGAAYDDAMRFLTEGDAVIIDLRGNPGGSHAAVRYLVSHFLDDDKPLMTFLEGNDPPTPSRTLEYLPAGRLKGKPLYVLISGSTASAAEEFAYHVQQFKLGELIGANTAGAANNNRFLPVAPGFMLSVSYGRPLHSVSHANWEGVGVAPSVRAEPTQALEVAQLLALQRLASAPDASPENRAEYVWAQTAVEARLHPAQWTQAQLQALVGRYGDAHITLRDGALWFARPQRPTLRLLPLTADGLFGLEGMETLRARLTGKTVELMQLGQSGSRVLTRS